ncbi:hypothetical protein CCACVL1_02985, partial [Corchorus capsularis]
MEPWEQTAGQSLNPALFSDVLELE